MNKIVLHRFVPLLFTVFLAVGFQAAIVFRSAKASMLSVISTNQTQQKSHHQRGPSLDVLAVGSLSRLDYLEAQQATFGSANATRHFFNATERDDFDPNCHRNLAIDDVKEILRFCRRRDHGINVTIIQSDIPRFFMGGKYNKGSTRAPWLCAQQRPLAGLMKVMETYENSASFPDYLMIIDDDTFIRPAAILANLLRYQSKDNSSSSRPFALAGYIFNRRSTFSFPYGGFGLILSRGLLLQMVEPIQENSPVFQRIMDNHFGEAAVFRRGMNLLELFVKKARSDSFVTHANWTFPGYCMHSDWVMGYMLRVMGVAMKSLSPEDLRSNEGEKCLTPASDVPIVCHYAMPSIMRNLHNRSQY
jgi:hypothetical protein